MYAYKKWSQEDTDFLINNYKDMPFEDMEKALNRTKQSLQQKAKRLGLKRSYAVGGIQARWTREETDFLIRNFEDMPFEAMEKALNRTEQSIRGKAKNLGLKRGWTQEEVDFLIQNYEEKGPQYCADWVGRSYYTTGQKANSLGLKALTRYENRPTHVYYIYFEDYDLEKIGVTANLEVRFDKIGSKPVIIKSKLFENGLQAFKKEQELLDLVAPYKINEGVLRTGNTETFRAPPELQEKILECLV